VERIGVAGGIGAGKSAVTDYLAELGWPVVDADQVAREVVEPGRPAWQALRDAFGDAVLDPEGRLDRAFVAELVFHDRSALRRLNHVTHGHIGAEIHRQLATLEHPTVFVALPLFRPEHREIFEFAEVWSVQADPEIAVARLMQYRGFRDDEARARIANQMSNEERAAIVDQIIWNEGTLAELRTQVDVLLEGRRRG